MTDDRQLNLDLLPTLIGYNLRRAQISVFSDFEKTMKNVGITPGQFGVITLISANTGITQSALARAVGIERSTMVAVIDALEERNLLERHPSPIDRRSNALVLSSKGADLFKILKPMVLDHEERIAVDISSEEKTQLLQLLSKLT